METTFVQKYQLIVVGGGPAGLMAAGQASKMGAKTILLEKMTRPGRKLRITGKGRCNLTNIATISESIDHFGPNGRFLRQVFGRFFNTDLIAFFDKLGIPTETERGGRVFPVSGRAQDVVDALVQWVKKAGVDIRTRSPADHILTEGKQVKGVQVSPKSAGKENRSNAQHTRTRQYLADRVIVATGGASYPDTGSAGDSYHLAESVGHAIVPIRPALVPLETVGNIAARLEGLTLHNVLAKVYINGKKQAQGFGEMIFTQSGVSGPIILSLSRLVVDALHMGRNVILSIDLKPAMDEGKLDARLLRDLDNYGKRQYHTLLKGLLPNQLIPVSMDMTGISPHKVGHQIAGQERKRLRKWLKDFRLEVNGHRPLSEALITAGGVDTREIDPRTMSSRLVKGLYFSGEALDIDADTGGYNLQAAFSTGWVAGRSAAQSLLD